MTRLNGKTAVITGGATGIGLAAAKRFIEEGAFVFIFGRRQDALDAAVAELGANARAVAGSVADEADLDRLYAAVKAERGSLDIVFANAGAGGPLKLGEITTEIRPASETPYYYAEDPHQQYLAKNPFGYRCHANTGVAFPA